jgi:hypothetical protein
MAAYNQALGSLWKWHNTAKALDQPSPYLNRIVEVALAFSQDKPSSLSAEATMQRDLNVHQVVTTFQKVLQHLGKPTGNENGELIFRGKDFYQVQGISNNFKLESHDRGIILVVAQGGVQKSDFQI